MAQAEIHVHADSVRRRTSHNKIKTTANAITETQEYDLEEEKAEERLTVWETSERGETFQLSPESSAKVLASLVGKPVPNEAALKATQEFNRRVRENNGVRTIR